MDGMQLCLTLCVLPFIQEIEVAHNIPIQS
jgi:hypothetical protein